MLLTQEHLRQCVLSCISIGLDLSGFGFYCRGSSFEVLKAKRPGYIHGEPGQMVNLDGRGHQEDKGTLSWPPGATLALQVEEVEEP